MLNTTMVYSNHLYVSRVNAGYTVSIRGLCRRSQNSFVE